VTATISPVILKEFDGYFKELPLPALIFCGAPSKIATMDRRIIALAVLLALFLSSAGHSAELTLHNAPVHFFFSPSGGATQAIVQEIDSAKQEILVQAYSFTSTPIARALVEARSRGLSVEAILDKSQRTEKYSGATFLANNRVPTYIDAAHAIAHNKVMIIDRQTVITGSFNFTKAAEQKNAENLLMIRSKELAGYYLENWQRHRQHSERYQGKY
jgi:phosphatidylserine/phosphatidylglycerophosphate/cardiolipin synthase-like enzyme